MPLGGAAHRLRHVGGGGAPVRLEGGEIRVAGRPEHMARRVRDWLRGEARRRIEPVTAARAAEIGRSVTRITIRDQKSRWGSCAPGGRLSFNWRLVLAPGWVLDYVVAHEVAHLVEANHSAAFWQIVERLDGNAAEARNWLRRHGLALQRYG